MLKFTKDYLSRNTGFKNRMQSVVEKRMSDGLQDIRVFANEGTSEKNPELLIVGDIGDNWWGESITGREVLTFMAANRGKDVDVTIDCPGGDVYDGMVMMNAFLEHDAAVNGKIIGLCYSAASYVALGCSKLSAMETSNYGIHPAWSYTMGNQYAHQDSIAWLSSIDTLITNVLSARTGMAMEDVQSLFKGNDNDGTIMTAKEAFDYGFIDAIIPLKLKDKVEEETETEDEDSEEETEESGETDDNKSDSAATKAYQSQLLKMQNKRRAMRIKDAKNKAAKLAMMAAQK